MSRWVDQFDRGYSLGRLRDRSALEAVLRTNLTEDGDTKDFLALLGGYVCGAESTITSAKEGE